MKLQITFWLLLAISLQLNGQNSAEEIMLKSYESYKYFGEDRIVAAHMEIKNASGKVTMDREVVIIRKNVPNSLEQKWYSYFQRPADIRKMVFMAWKNTNKDDDRWVYLPALDLVKRLAGSDKRSSFAGSQFVYEDVTGRNPNLDIQSIDSEDDQYYIIKSVPKVNNGLEFSYFKTWVDKSTFIPMKAVFYDKQEKAARQYQVHKVEKIQGFDSVTEFSMTNLQSNESTYVTYSNMKYNVGIEDNLFTEAYLRRSPRKWLQIVK